jgi:hypothetical protein
MGLSPSEGLATPAADPRDQLLSGTERKPKKKGDMPGHIAFPILEVSPMQPSHMAALPSHTL